MGIIISGVTRDEYEAKLEAEIKRLRSALETLLINYGAALPEGKKDQRSIQKAREALGLTDGQSARE